VPSASDITPWENACHQKLQTFTSQDRVFKFQYSSALVHCTSQKSEEGYPSSIPRRLGSPVFCRQIRQIKSGKILLLHISGKELPM
jgi:hypothetical protein